jgi:PAS domain S-box-containing protein
MTLVWNGERMNDPSQKITAEVVAVITGILGALAAAWKFWRMIGPKWRQWRTARAAHRAGVARLPHLIDEMAAIRAQLERGPDPIDVLDSLRRVESAIQGVRLTTWSILDVSGIAFWESDAEGKATYISAKLAEMTGLTPAAALGNGWVATLHPDDRNKVFDEWEAAVRQRRLFAMKYRFQHMDGRVVIVWGKGLPIYGANGQFSGFVGVLKELEN